MLNYEFFFIFLSLFIIILIAILPFALSYFFNYQDPNIEKISSYECGFQPFEDSRQQFNIEFYLIGILFVIFDLEIVFLFPTCVVFDYLNLINLIIILIFLLILTIDLFMNY